MRPIELSHDGPEVGFAATRVGVLLERLRLHLETDRFLAERRRDAIWESGCDYAALALGRLASRMRASALHQSIRCAPAAESRRRVALAARSLRFLKKKRRAPGSAPSARIVRSGRR